MNELPALIKDLALILVTAGIVTLIFKRLRQPLVLGYIVAGFLVSPQMPYTMSVVDKADVQTWADIGVVFLLFSLGLDFSFKKILKMGVAPVIAACTIIFFMMFSGYTVGQAFGWSQMDCIFLGGMLAMSSTTIIYKAFDDMGLRQQRFAGLVMSVLILEDVLAIVLMVMLSAVAGGSSPDGGQMLGSVLSIVFFLVLWFVVGIFVIPALLRGVRRLIGDETLLIVSLAFCFLMAVFSTKVGFSSAFGAFVMGSILAETVEAERIIKIVEPVKNLFGAIFFVSVGMLVDVQVLIDYALPILAIVMTILIGQALFGSFGYLISGQTLKTSLRCGFSMAQIGEFAFIIASLGLSLGVVSHFLYPVVVAVSVITTFLTPYMIRLATPAYSLLERHLPAQAVSFLNNITLGGPSTTEARSTWKPMLTAMAANTLVYSILSVAAVFVMLKFFHPFVVHLFRGMYWTPNLLCGFLTLTIIAPFLRAMIMKKNHSQEFKLLWEESRVNRLPLLFTVLVRIIVSGAFVLYVISSLFQFGTALLVTLAVVAIVCMMTSRSLKNRSIRIERLFVKNLRSRDIEARVLGHKRPLYEGRLLDRDIHTAEVDVPANSLWAGRSLKEIAPGAKYGVMVSSILRANRRINIPDGRSVIFPFDKIQAIGTDEQLAALAKALADEVYHGDANLEKREMKLRQIAVRKGGVLAGKTIAQSGIRDIYNCMAVGLEEGKETLSQIDRERAFEAGDILWVVGETEAVEELALKS